MRDWVGNLDNLLAQPNLPHTGALTARQFMFTFEAESFLEINRALPVYPYGHRLVDPNPTACDLLELAHAVGHLILPGRPVPRLS